MLHTGITVDWLVAGSGLLQTRRRLQLTEPWREDHITCQPGVGWTVAGAGTGASRQRPGETPSRHKARGQQQPGPASPGCSLAPACVRPAPVQGRLQRGGEGERGQTRADGRGPDTGARPGPDTLEIQPASTGHRITLGCIQEAAIIRPTFASHKEHLSFCGELWLFSVLADVSTVCESPRPPAAGLPPPPLPRLASSRARVRTMQSPLSSPHTSHHPRQVSLSLSRNRFCNLYTS